MPCDPNQTELNRRCARLATERNWYKNRIELNAECEESERAREKGRLQPIHTDIHSMHRNCLQSIILRPTLQSTRSSSSAAAPSIVGVDIVVVHHRPDCVSMCSLKNSCFSLAREFFFYLYVFYYCFLIYWSAIVSFSLSLSLYAHTNCSMYGRYVAELSQPAQRANEYDDGFCCCFHFVVMYRMRRPAITSKMCAYTSATTIDGLLVPFNNS